jgi:hypothetical protein
MGRGADVRRVGGAVSVVARGNRVVYRGVGLREWYAAGPLGLEQGFTIARRPAGARGPVAVVLALGGSLRAELVGSQVEFLTPSGRVGLRYGGLAAVDATGRRLPAALVLRGRSIWLQIADHRARYPLRIDPFIQQGAKLVADDETPAGTSSLGDSVAVSSDGGTALVGGPLDNNGAGAAWVFVRSGQTWSQQDKLVGTGAIPPVKGLGSEQGTSVALSADGNTALVGGPHDNGGAGAVWVFGRSGSTWTQRQELTANNETGNSGFGAGTALSADGSTALIGGPRDNSQVGAAWVFSQSSGSFSQQQKLTVTDETAQIGEFGSSVALSGDHSTALIGGPFDNSQGGAAWVFTHPSGSWSEAAKLVGTGNVGAAGQGTSVALSEDGGIALIGGPFDNNEAGAAWVFAPSGVGGSWIQRQKLTVGDETGGDSQFGTSVSLSSDGSAGLIGGPEDNTSAGAAWLLSDSSGSWSELQKLTGSDESGASGLGSSVALSGDRSTALTGGPNDNGGAGAAWVFAQPPPANTAPPVISGTPTAGQVLSCSSGSWTNTPTSFAYQWARDGTSIGGATNSTYIVQTADQGHSLTCTVTASNLGGSAAATSAAVPVAAIGPVGPPTVPPATLPSSVAFTISPDTDPLLANQTVTFAVGNPVPGVSYQWNFNDQTSPAPTATVVAHQFANPGVYAVSVQAQVGTGKITSPTQNVVVVAVQKPTAGFTVLRSSQGANNPSASTAVTHPVTIVPQALLPETASTAQDRIVREDFWLNGSGPPAAPDITCLPNATCTQVAGEQNLGTGPVRSGDARYSPTAGFESFSMNFWNAALQQIGSPSAGFASTPRTTTLPQAESIGSTTGTPVYTPLTVGYPPLGSVDLDRVDGYQGEQGIPYAACLPGDRFADIGVTPSPFTNSECDFLVSDQIRFPAESGALAKPYNDLAVAFGPYDLAQYGVNSPQQLEDQWNFLYNYATVVGVDTPLDDQFGPATGATEGHDKTTIPRKVTMVAYDAEGVPSAPVTQDVPLTPASNPKINFCLENVGHSPCVNTPAKAKAKPLPFSITSGDTLRFKLSGAQGGADPIRYYAVEVGQPNTSLVTPPAFVSKKPVSDCSWPSEVGSWFSGGTGAPPASAPSGPTGGNPGQSSGGTTGPKTPTSGPKANADRAGRVVAAHASGAAPALVPVFSDLDAGAFAPHDCQAYADRTVDAAAGPGAVPKSGPNTILHKASARRAVQPGGLGPTTLQAATQPTVVRPAPTVANPVLITTPGHNLDFTLPHPGTYSVSIAAYTSAGLGAITRIDGLLAEPGRHAGRCETVESETLHLSAPVAFSGSCFTVITQGKHPDLYVSPGTMDVSGVPIAPEPGDSIVVDTDSDPNQLYVTKCSISDTDLNQGSKFHNPCPEPDAAHAGTLYLALGSGKGGLPGIAHVTKFTGKQADTMLTPLASGLTSKGALEPVGKAPKQRSNPVTDCGLYPASQQWQRTAGAVYDGFSVATLPCVAFSKTGQSRVAYWDSLPKGFGDGATQNNPTSQVLLYGSDVPAVSDLSTSPYASVARSGHRPKPVIAGSFPTLRAHGADAALPGFPKIPSCPPSTSLKSGLSIPKDTDLGPVSMPVGAQFCYDSSTGDFIGNVTVSIPAPLPLNNVEVGFELGHGHLIAAGGEISGNPGVAVGPVLISDLKFDIQTDPTVVAGAITASIADLLSVDAGVIVDSYQSKTTPSVDLEGTVSIADIQFGDFAIDFGPQGVGMHVTISKDFGPASLNISVKGALGFSPPAFYLEGGGDLCLFLCLDEVTGLVSNQGLAACGTINLVLTSFSGGIAVMWSGANSGVHVFTGCDLEPYIPPSLRNVSGAVRHAQAEPRAGPGGLATRAAKQPVLAPGGTEQLSLCPQPGETQADCSTSTAAVQVHSLVSDEAPGTTPLVTLTGPGGQRVVSTPTTPGYYGFDSSARMSGGLAANGQTDEGTSLVDQNPVPVDDTVSDSQAYCPAGASTKLLTLASSCPKVTTTTLFVAAPGTGEWTLSVAGSSPPIVDSSVAAQEPPVKPQQFNSRVRKVALTSTAHGFNLRIAGHTLSSSLLDQPHRLLLAPSVEITPPTPKGFARLVSHPTVADLDVPAIDTPRLRAIMLKVPSSFQGSYAVLDQGSSASQIIASHITRSDIPNGGLPIVFQPMANAGSHQQIEVFLSNSAGMPSRMITASSFTPPPEPAPRPPKIIKVVRDGSGVDVYFDPGNAPIANGIGLALTARNGQQLQDTFTAGQLHPAGRLVGIGAAKQAREYRVSIALVDPTVSIQVSIDGSNDGKLSAASRPLSMRPVVSSISESRLLASLKTRR